MTDRAARRLPPDFADRVLRAARGGAERMPSLFSQCMLSAATVALCFLAIAFFQSRTSQSQDSGSLADWQQFASAAEDSSLVQ